MFISVVVITVISLITNLDNLVLASYQHPVHCQKIFNKLFYLVIILFKNYNKFTLEIFLRNE